MKTGSLAAVLALALCAPSLAGAAALTLAEAVKAGDHVAVAGLLKNHASPNLKLSDTSPVLSWAVMHQDPKVTRLLLAAGANPNAADLDGVSPLLIGCELSDPSIVTMLIDAKADMKARRPDGISAVEVCARNSTPAVLKRMLAAGAQVNTPDKNGQTPLMWAAMGGNADNITLLLKHGAKVNAASAKGFQPLYFAIKSMNAKALDVLLAAGADVNHTAADGTTPIMLATYQKNFPAAVVLANRGAELTHFDLNGNQPLHVAAIEGQVELAKVLIAKGADVNIATIAPKVNWQTEPNAGRNPPPKFVAASPLLVAAQNGHADVMKALIAGGAKKDWKGEDRGNVVLAAAIGGSTEALDYAIELQPDLTAANETGQTAMHLVLANRKAQVRGHLSPETPEMVRLLGRKGAPLLAKNDRGQTPESSTRNADPEIVAAFADAKQLAGIKPGEAADTGKRVAQ